MVVIINCPPPTDGIRLCESNTSAFLKEKDLGKGTIYIAESQLAWISELGEGFTLLYPTISLHAISKDVSSFPQECLYLMIAESLSDNEPSGTESDSEDDKISEIRFVPENKTKLDEMFKAMSDCQALHPSEPLSSEDEEGCYDDAEEDDGEYDVSAAEGAFGAGDPGVENMALRNGQEEEQPMDIGQFDDAEPEH